MAQKKDENLNFRKNRVDSLKTLYSDDASAARRSDRTPTYRAGIYKTAAEVRKALLDAEKEPTKIVEASKKLYATNPIYKNLIDYLKNMFMWSYKVTPHRLYTPSKAKAKKQIKTDDFRVIYNYMLEIGDGLSIETKFPAILALTMITGSCYFTTIVDEDTMSIDTILLPTKYCKKIGETQFGTAVIQFDYSYFDTLGKTQQDRDEYVSLFSEEFVNGYRAYKKDSTLRWGALDPRFSTCLMFNEMAIPTMFYLYGGILDYEKYQDNELERNENKLKYIVTHKMPIYQDKLVFEVDEVDAIHKSLARVINNGEKARLVTTYGDIDVKQMSENDTSENQVLAKAFNSIFNNAGFNNTLFTGESVEALKMSLIRDKGMVWSYVQQLISFYNITINNWFSFKNYEANIDILPISSYTYNDDIERYRANATLGVGKLDFIIASGIKQRNIEDQFTLEAYLQLDKISPMQTSYTQSAVDRENIEADKKDDSTDVESSKTGIEPTDNKEDSSLTETSK